MRFRYLTFDCYGTLIDWKTGIESELRAAIGPVRMDGGELLNAYVNAEKVQEAAYAKYREVIRRTLLSMSDLLGVPIPDAAARRFADSVPRWPVFSDTKAFLRQMGSEGYKRYILSNIDNDLLEETIRRNGLEVDGFVTAEQVGTYKPMPGHWVRFMQKTGARRDEILHVAQSVYHDIIPAQEIGIESAWVNRYNEAIGVVAAPLFVSDSLAHLQELIEKA